MDRTLMGLLDPPTRFLFFTGKGGVGKTSTACALAVALADRGAHVLLVSTDPASNLDDVLGTPLSSVATSIDTVPRLSALNLDPEVAAREYKEAFLAPYRGVLPKAALDSMDEQLSGACSVEIAAFDQFSRLLGEKAATADYDHVLFDTAPTGHTLRLLSLPAAWDGFIAANAGGSSCLGPLAGLQAKQSLYAAALRSLRDASATTLVLVTQPDRSALLEAERTRAELSALGVQNQRLVMNGIFRGEDPSDSLAIAYALRSKEALGKMPPGLAALPRVEVPLYPFSLIGAEALRFVIDPSARHLHGVRLISQTPAEGVPRGSLAELVEELAAPRRGAILVMGKGGVGKTTLASAIALELARRGFPVHLSTTDPAAHLDTTLGDAMPGLRVSRIDPIAETRAYSDEVMATAGRDLDAAGLALLEEDLRSPCTEETAVFRAFARVLDDGQHGFVVLDTAPTGHTLLLLDATESYHREVSRSLADLPASVRTLLPRLRDPGFTRVLLVTLPELTPVREAARLQDDLVRAGIRPFAWIANQSLFSSYTRDPILQARAANEPPFLDEIASKLASRMAVVPVMPQSPTGAADLLRLLDRPAQVPPALAVPLDGLAE